MAECASVNGSEFTRNRHQVLKPALDIHSQKFVTTRGIGPRLVECSKQFGTSTKLSLRFAPATFAPWRLGSGRMHQLVPVDPGSN